MKKKIIILAGMLALAVNAHGANLTYSSVGTWESIVLTPPATGDRLYFNSGANISLSSTYNYPTWIYVAANPGGSLGGSATLSILSGGYYNSSAGNHTIGGGNGTTIYGRTGTLNLSGYYGAAGAIYLGSNGNTGIVNITGGTLTTNNTIWLGRVDATASAICATSTGSIYMSSGSIVAASLNIAYYNTSVGSMSGRVNLQGGSLSVSSMNVGYVTTLSNEAHLTISSAMTQAKVGALTLSGTASLTLDAAASTDWTSKGAILAVTGTFNISSTSTIVLNLSDFDGWDGMTAGDKITMTLATYNALTLGGTPTVTAVGLSEDFTLGTFNLGTNAATVEITYNPIPEPAMAAGLLGGAVLLLAVRRRRKL